MDDEPLRSALDELTGADLASMGDARLKTDLVELTRVGEALETQRQRRLPSWTGGRRTPSRVPIRSRLIGCPLPDGLVDGSRELRVARALEAMPQAGTALMAGEISYSPVRVLAAARESHPEVFAVPRVSAGKPTTGPHPSGDASPPGLRRRRGLGDRHGESEPLDIGRRT